MESHIVTTEQLCELQKSPEKVRNVCILAHVDHGKTSLADCLIASNGIISRRSAGQLRYLDSREDEQQRGITMKSSAITLRFPYQDRHHSNYLINLIDSPGHVDFSSEVGTAVRLCDGAIIVIDVVEGILAQTHAVLRQVWQGKIVPVLVLNKIDRLITELHLTPEDAYSRLFKLLEDINNITSTLLQGQHLKKITQLDEEQSAADCEVTEESLHSCSDEQNTFQFSPESGNVVFSSAIDGWAFSLDTVSRFYSAKLGFSFEVLKRTLWGDYYMIFKQKKIMKNAYQRGKRPLFVDLILENIWSVYNAVTRKDKAKIEKIAGTLGVKLSLRDTQGKDPRPTLLSIMSQWMPVSRTVLASVCDCVPPPSRLSEERVIGLLTTENRAFQAWPESTRRLKHSFLRCSSADHEPVIVYVSKMVAYDVKSLPQNRKAAPVQLSPEQLERKREEVIARRRRLVNQSDVSPPDDSTANNAEIDKCEEAEAAAAVPAVVSGTEFVAFARVFSGKVRSGQQLFVLGPKHDPCSAGTVQPAEGGVHESLEGVHAMRATIGQLYVLMGRELEMVDEVPAGNLLGISGLGDFILKSATVSSTLHCPAFTALTDSSLGIIRVAVSTKKAGDLPQLIKGLKLLNQADTNVQVLLQETGEHVLLTAGEVHLERCLRDLAQFSQVEISASDPIVPYRETIIPRPRTDRANELIVNAEKKQQFATFQDANFYLKLSAVPIPPQISKFLLDNCSRLKQLDLLFRQEINLFELPDEKREDVSKLSEELCELFDDHGKFWKAARRQIWAFGPNRVGPNILLNQCTSGTLANRPGGFIETALDAADSGSRLAAGGGEFDSNIVHGFQLACNSGVLVEEPLMGVAVVMHEFTVSAHQAAPPVAAAAVAAGVALEEEEEETGGSAASSSVSTFTATSGKLISAMKDLTRKAVQLQPCRLMEAMYKCDVTVTSEKLGQVHAVLNKRRVDVLSEDMTEDFTSYHIVASLPVQESFGFVGEIRLKTSGLAYPQLVFSHWALVEEDPFWVPTTEEEKMLYGDTADRRNLALLLVNSIRKRKGLGQHSKLVEFAEKQRTLARKK